MNISPVVGVPFGARTLAGPGIEAVQLPTGFGCSPGRQADSCLARGHASTISTCKVSTKAQSSKSSNRSPRNTFWRKEWKKLNEIHLLRIGKRYRRGQQRVWNSGTMHSRWYLKALLPRTFLCYGPRAKACLRKALLGRGRKLDS